MSVPSRLAAFAVLIGLVFGGAVLLGATIDPTEEPVAATGHGGGSGAHGGAADSGDDHEGAAPDDAATDHGAHAPAGAEVGGLAVAQDGYALDFERTRFAATGSTPLRFRITDAGGRAVTDDFRVEHEKRLHMIVVRRDTAVFRHVHPTMRADGTWEVDVDLAEPGVYRAYADFTTGDGKRTLAADLFVPGDFAPRALPAPRATGRAVDGAGSSADRIDVTLDAPPIRAGRETQLTFAAIRGGRPLEALEPYLGAKGHLVALRDGDLAYLHVHPTEGEGHEHGSSGDAEPHADETSFAATFPTAGRYRLFLQFKVDGRVRTVDYTVEVAR